MASRVAEAWLKIGQRLHNLASALATGPLNTVAVINQTSLIGPVCRGTGRAGMGAVPRLAIVVPFPTVPGTERLRRRTGNGEQGQIASLDNGSNSPPREKPVYCLFGLEPEC